MLLNSDKIHIWQSPDITVYPCGIYSNIRVSFLKIGMIAVKGRRDGKHEEGINLAAVCSDTAASGIVR